ncbi:MAG: hypothetical protein ACTH31_08970 [Pseudoclavibacter sp.]
MATTKTDNDTAAEQSGLGALIRSGTVAMLIGATVMIMLHETSHSVAGMLLGYGPVQLAFAVDYSPVPTPEHQAITAFTGPIFSLAFGIAGVIVDSVAKPLRSRPFWRLTWLWLVFTSLMEAIGYFMIAGVFQAGDTAVAFGIWDVPVWGYIASFLLGTAGMFGIAWLFSRPMMEITHSRREMLAITTWSWMSGTVAFILLSILYFVVSPAMPIEAIIAVAAAAMSIAVFSPMSNMFSGQRTKAPAPLKLPSHPIAGYIVLAALVLLNLSLAFGWLWP